MFSVDAWTYPMSIATKIELNGEAYCPHCYLLVQDGVSGPWPPGPSRCPHCRLMIGPGRARPSADGVPGARGAAAGVMAERARHIEGEPEHTDGEVMEAIRAVARQTGVAPERLCLELTESAAVDAGTAPLAELKALGVSLALDDFGTGFSSLDQVRRLPPVDELKIDRSFVEELGASRGDSAIAAAIIGIAGALGLTTIAEGIEHESQVYALLEIGCEHGQGYFYSRPVEAGEIQGLLESAALGELRA